MPNSSAAPCGNPVKRWNPNSAAYWELSRRWLRWGVLATVPLVFIVFLMVLKV
jgi:hypothetical protein